MSQTALDSLALLDRLIAFPTVSRDSNLDLIAFVSDYLAEWGVQTHLVHDDTGRKANLYCTIGPEDVGGVVLSGHTDVVPVDGQAWDSDPFAATRRDGRIYGRGTCDMEGFIALCLALVPELVDQRLSRPVHFAFSYDEEVGCLGVPRLIAHLETMPVRPVMAIIGEPTEMKLVTGHKGKLSMRCHVRGHECHSSTPHHGANAVEAAAELIAFLKRTARRLRDEGPFDPAYDPPYTTVHTGTIRGGTALNIVPADCVFDFEFRTLPVSDPAELLAAVEDHARSVIEPELKAVEPSAGFRFERLAGFPGLATAEDSDITQLVKGLTGANGTGMVSFGTEAGLFSASGIPAIVCGPGNIEQAHKPNEYIEAEQMVAGERMLRRLIDHLAA